MQKTNVKDDNAIEIKSELAVIYADIPETEQTNLVQKHNRINRGIILFIVLLVCIVIAFFGVNGVKKANLERALIGEWYDVKGSVIKVLDFSQSGLEYRLETGYRFLDKTLGIYDWRPISWNRIKVEVIDGKYRTHTIEFNSKKDSFRVTPAITSLDPYEYWVQLD